MNIQKLVIITTAVLINVLVLMWFHAWTVATVASATPRPAPVEKILTLPVVHVHPTAAQLRALGRPVPATSAPPQADAGGGIVCIDMPFYSFATPCAVGAIG